MKPPTQKQAKAAALAMHAAIVKHNTPGCEAAAILRTPCSVGARQCAHIVPKHANLAVSVDPLNGWALCPGHHLAVDADPTKWLQMVAATCGTGIVLEWRAAVDRSLDEGLTVEQRPVSKLRWWRHQIKALNDYANEYRVAVPVPVHIRRWLDTGPTQ